MNVVNTRLGFEADLSLTLPSASDEDLFRRFRAGEEMAFRILLDRHFKMVRRLARNILADESEADDVAQETFVAVWKGADKWDGDGSRFSTWLYRVAVNKAIDHRRRRRAIPQDGAAIERAADSELPAREGRQTQELCRQQISGALGAALQRLPDNQRQAITLFYFEECEVNEIARTMNLSEMAVRSLLKRGRGALREHITKQKKICWNDYFGTDGWP